MALKTIKPSGGDYTSLSAWEAGEQADLTSTLEIATAECYSMADTTSFDVDGWTTSATYYIRIYTPTSERHDGKWNTAKYRLTVGHARAIRIYEAYIRLEGLQISNNLTYATSVPPITYISATAGEIIIDSCLIKEQSAIYTDMGINLEYVTGVVARTAKIKNTIVYDLTKSGASGIRCYDNDFTIYTHNVTVHNCNIGLNNSGGGTWVAKNCGMAGCTTPISGTVTQTTCSTATPTFVDEAGDDFHLASGDTTWKDAGTDLSGDANYPFSDDIDGGTRSGTWDIGADEYIAAGGGFQSAWAVNSNQLIQGAKI